MLVKTSIKWGIVLGIVLVVATQVLTWLWLGLTNWFVFLTFFSVVVVVALGLENIKRLDGGNLKFVNAAIAVVIIVLVSRYIFQFYMFVYINYIDPNWVNSVAEIWKQSMQKTDLSPEMIDQRIETFRQAWQTLPMFTVEILFGGISQIVIGLLTSLYFVFGKKSPANMV